jgi:hypothetical protein
MRAVLRPELKTQTPLSGNSDFESGVSDRDEQEDKERNAGEIQIL